MIYKRIDEKKHLQNYYNRNDNQIVVMYGSKFCGKNDLIKDFLKDKEYSYYSARACSDEEQLLLWKNELKEDLPKNYEFKPDYSGIISAIMNLSGDKKVIVIDEFQNLLKFDNHFMEAVIHSAHNKWNYKPVMFLLCSSATYWVENQMVDKLKDMAFEISGLLKLNELKFSQLKNHFKNYNLEQLVETYGIIGGLPDIWKIWDDNKAVSDNICDLCLKEHAPLYEYGKNILPSELREPVVYNTLLSTLAKGINKLNDIYKHTGFSRAKISVYLKNLIELDIVEKIDSYNSPGHDNTKKGIYKIKSPFIHFWFRYIFKNQSKLNLFNPDKFYTKYIQKDYAGYSSYYFTKACSELLDIANQADKLKFRYTTKGIWLGKVGTIDTVAQNDEGKTLVALCNYDKPAMTYADYEWLLYCIKQARLDISVIYLFSAGDFDLELKQEAMLKDNLVLVDSDNLFKLSN